MYADGLESGRDRDTMRNYQHVIDGVIDWLVFVIKALYHRTIFCVYAIILIIAAVVLDNLTALHNNVEFSLV